MTPDDVIRHYVNGYRFNKMTGMSSNSIRNWLKSGHIPECSQLKLEYITNGQLTAATKERTDEHKKLNKVKEK